MAVLQWAQAQGCPCNQETYRREKAEAALAEEKLRVIQTVSEAVGKVRQMMSQRQMMLSGMSEGTIDKDTKSGTGSPTQALAQALAQGTQALGLRQTTEVVKEKIEVLESAQRNLSVLPYSTPRDY